MRVEEVDERHLVQSDDGANFVVFIYFGSDDPDISWSVYSYLITDADLPEVLGWLTEELPTDSDADLDTGTIICRYLGPVRHPARPTTESDVDIAWIVGSDVSRASLSSHEQPLADEMLARRHHVTFV